MADREDNDLYLGSPLYATREQEQEQTDAYDDDAYEPDDPKHPDFREAWEQAGF